MSNELPVLFRAMAEEDAPLIYSSWLKSFRSGFFCKNVDNTIYYHNQHKIIEACMHKGKVIICCNADDPKTIYGYICFEEVEGQFVLHYLYIKNLYRNLGLARMLLSRTGHDFDILGCYTHQTVASLAKENKYNLVYHPYLLFNLDKK